MPKQQAPQQQQYHLVLNNKSIPNGLSFIANLMRTANVFEPLRQSIYQKKESKTNQSFIKAMCQNENIAS